MTILENLRTALVSVGAFLLATQTHAITTSDATIFHGTGGFKNASAIALGSGEITDANIDGLTGLFDGDHWSLLDRTNKSSKTFNNMNFLLTADTGRGFGEWSMDWTGTDVPEYMDYVLVLKSGKKWGAFLFDSVSLHPERLGGSFAISWPNTKGKIAKLRHASIFGRVGAAPVNPTDPNNAVVTNQVPTPGSLALVVIGMGMGLMAIRRRQITVSTVILPQLYADK